MVSLHGWCQLHRLSGNRGLNAQAYKLPVTCLQGVLWCLHKLCCPANEGASQRLQQPEYVAFVPCQLNQQRRIAKLTCQLKEWPAVSSMTVDTRWVSWEEASPRRETSNSCWCLLIPLNVHITSCEIIHKPTIHVHTSNYTSNMHDCIWLYYQCVYSAHIIHWIAERSWSIAIQS